VNGGRLCSTWAHPLIIPRTTSDRSKVFMPVEARDRPQKFRGGTALGMT
jgi:hypothetical protein